MQKGKGYRDGLERTVMILALALALPHGRCEASDTWERGMGRVILPRRGHPAASRMPDGYLLASVSAANPFSIPGLCESTASLALERRSCMAGISWERTGVKGYSRDRLEAYFGMALPARLFHMAVVVRADSRKVACHGRQTDLSALWSLTLDVSQAVVAELEAGGLAGDAPARATLMAGNGDTSLVLTLGRDVRHWRVARAGGSFHITDRLLFLAGYEIVTGEVSGGMAFRAGPVTTVSWSMHPVLGTTFSISVGAVR